MLILNDIHIGHQRKGGTTPKSREKLRSYLFTQLQLLLDEQSTGSNKLVVMGDLFDQFEVDPRDWVETFNIFVNWLAKGNSLTLVAGNHDHSPRANRVSSFEMLCQVLDNVGVETVGDFEAVHVDEYLRDGSAIFLAHCSNQDIFNLKLEELLHNETKGGDTLFVHANYDNKFTAQSDHSLNISRELAQMFRSKCVRLVFAHEHQAREDLGGYVYIMGNQWPTSIADCLGNDYKKAHCFTPTDELIQLPTWARDSIPGGYVEVDWHNLSAGNADFIRITGEATAAEASDVINTLATFRRESEAFVITNAVRIGGIAEISELPETFEAAKAFDVLDFIDQHLDEAERKVVRELLATS